MINVVVVAADAAVATVDVDVVNVVVVVVVAVVMSTHKFDHLEGFHVLLLSHDQLLNAEVPLRFRSSVVLLIIIRKRPK